jgi:hypothetical protein
MAHKNYFYWLLCRDPDTGKPFLIAGGDTEDAARSKGLECLGGIDFEVRRLPTRNLARASSMIRGVRLEETHSLKKASQKLGHTKSVRRMLERRSRKQ